MNLSPENATDYDIDYALAVMQAGKNDNVQIEYMERNDDAWTPCCRPKTTGYNWQKYTYRVRPTNPTNPTNPTTRVGSTDWFADQPVGTVAGDGYTRWTKQIDGHWGSQHHPAVRTGVTNEKLSRMVVKSWTIVQAGPAPVVHPPAAPSPDGNAIASCYLEVFGAMENSIATLEKELARLTNHTLLLKKDYVELIKDRQEGGRRAAEVAYEGAALRDILAKIQNLLPKTPQPVPS